MLETLTACSQTHQVFADFWIVTGGLQAAEKHNNM